MGLAARTLRALSPFGLALALVGVVLSPATAGPSPPAPETLVGSATPILTPPLRTIKADVPAARTAAHELFTPAEVLPSIFDNSLFRDPVVQRSHGSGDMPGAAANFEGLNNVNGVLPPDTVGDIGPNHYFQWVNLAFAAYNRAGVRVLGPLNGNTLFAGHPVCGAQNKGDPIVLYDQYAGRWNVSQFAFVGSTPVTPPYYQCIAVSQTSDPTGAWWTYEFVIHPTKFNDYPKLSVWPSQNAYMMTAPQFTGGTAFSGIGVWAFERDKMLAGQVARFVYVDMASTATRMLPADADGSTPPPAEAPNPILRMNDDAFGGIDELELWNATVDWNAPSMSVVKESDLPTAPFDSFLVCTPTARGCIPQPGTSQRIDGLSNRLMHRLAYRNFGARQSMVVNHTVDANGAGLAGIRWYELRKTTGNWGIQDQGTYAPDGVYRFMGSAALDQTGNMAVGYSVSDGVSTFPGIRFAGRLVSDPPGQLAQGEATLVNGGGVQLSTSSRWGDYSSMNIDPTDDCTFWYTQEYYAATSTAGWQTRIGSFKFPNCATPPPPPPPAPPPPPPPLPPPPPAPRRPVVRRCVVPRVIGLKLATARTRIRRANCRVGRIRRVRVRQRRVGRVLAQSPRPRTRRARYFKVSLVVGRR
jgi:hypothetical protein